MSRAFPLPAVCFSLQSVFMGLKDGLNDLSSVPNTMSDNCQLQLQGTFGPLRAPTLLCIDPYTDTHTYTQLKRICFEIRFSYHVRWGASFTALRVAVSTPWTEERLISLLHIFGLLLKINWQHVLGFISGLTFCSPAHVLVLIPVSSHSAYYKL